jgi:glycerol-3-phosphate acyltransferase PlsY
VSPGLLAFAATVGYLAGSVQFARIIWARLRPGTQPEPLRTPTTDGRAELVAHAVGSSNVMVAFGPRWGMTVMLLDILKAFVPVLAWRLAVPDEPYFLVCAVAVLLGHIWPVWYRFSGGAGNASIMGMLLAIDPLALLVTHTLGMLLGRVFPLVAFLAGVVLTIPWFAWRAGIGSPEMWFAIAITVLYVASQLPEAAQMRRLKKAGHTLDVGHVMGMMKHSARTGRPGKEAGSDRPED